MAAGGQIRQTDRRGPELAAGADLSSVTDAEANTEAEAKAKAKANTEANTEADADSHTGSDVDAARRLDARVR